MKNKLKKCRSCSKSVGWENYSGSSELCLDCHRNVINNCDICQEHRGEVYPKHFAGYNCESGKENHCTCDLCF